MFRDVTSFGHNPTAVGLLCFLSMSGLLCASDDLRQQFLNDAPKKWLEYRRIVASHSVIAASYSTLDRVRQESERYSYSYTIDTGKQSVCYFEAKQGGSATNAGYHFSVVPVGQSEWMLKNLSIAPYQFPDDMIGRDLRRPLCATDRHDDFGLAISMACIGERIGGTWLPYMISAAGFKILSVTERDKDSGLIRVEYEFETIAPPDGAFARGGTMLLDKNRFWLLREAEVAADYNFDRVVRGRLKIVNEFKEYVDGQLQVPYVSRHTRLDLADRDSRGKKYDRESVYDIRILVAENGEEGRCYLGYYNLPEPRLPTATAVRWLLAFVVALMLVVLMIWAAVRVRRRGTASQ